MKRLFPLLALWITSCGEVKTGGFETSDLQARVHRKDGSPVASARVWLVRSRGDSAPAMALDSSWTDASGLANFPVPADGPMGLGLDVQREDSLGMAPLAFGSTSRASVLLSPSHDLSIPADSNGAPRCFVPGSHFASRSQSEGSGAVISLPQGTWDLAIARGAAAPMVTPFVVTKDSVVVVRPPVSDTDTGFREPFFPEGPDISMDSFQVQGRRYAVDRSFLPGWIVRKDTFSNSSFRQGSGSSSSSDSAFLTSGPARIPAFPDTINGQILTVLESARLPETGFIAMRFLFSQPLPADSGRYLHFELNDELGSGAFLNLNPRMRTISDSFQIQPRGSFLDSAQGMQTPEQKLSSQIWYFFWTPGIVEVRNSEGFVGVLRSSQDMTGRPTLKVTLGAFVPTPSSQVNLVSTRLYLPR